MNAQATATAAQHTNELRKAIGKLPAADQQEIRTAYYDAITALRTLFVALEASDLDYCNAEGGILIEEHLIAVEAYDALRRSKIGAVL